MRILQSTIATVVILYGHSVLANPITISAATGSLFAGYPSLSYGNVYSGPVSTTESVSYDSPFASGGFAIATVNPNIPGVTASSGDLTEASASLEYYFEVLGTPGTIVPVLVTGVIDADLTPNSNGAAEVDANLTILPLGGNSGLEFYDCETGSSGNCSLGPSATLLQGAFSGELYVEADQERIVEESALSNADDPYGILETTAVASVDPYIQIDPTFAAANPGYSVVVSAGINNSPIAATPEPSGLSLMIVALVMGGVFMGRGTAKVI